MESRGRAQRARFDVGAGIGAYRFEGTTVISGSLVRTSLPIRVRITFSELFAPALQRNHPTLRRSLRALNYQVGVDVLPGTLSNNEFSAPPNFKASWDVLTTYALTLDLLVLLEPWLRR